MTLSRALQVLIVGTLALFGSACALLRPTVELLVLEYPASEVAPTYQPNLRYLPIAQGDALTWVVLAEQKPVKGALQPVTIWYGQSGRVLRTHGGKLVEIIGYGPEPLRLADNCPYLSNLRRFRATDCVRSYMTQRAGVYMARVRVRQLSPEAVTYRLGGSDFSGSIVREQLSASGRPGNFYLFDAEGSYIMSRQWLTDTQSFDLFAAEQAQ